MDSPFRLLLKKYQNVRLGPKSTLDIPISFAPEEMRLYEALCIVTMTSVDGNGWDCSMPADAANQ